MSKGNNRETLDYYNRKFVVTLTGTIADYTGEVRFTIPPLNETGFSNGYNQCIIRLKEINIAGDQDGALADQVNPVFVQRNGGGLSTCQAGVLVKTSIPCRQVKHIASNYVAARWADGFDQSFHAICPVECKRTYIRSATALSGSVARGSSQVLQCPSISAAGAAEFNIDESVNFFHWIDTGSFEDSAVLCGVPFGQDHTFSVRDATNGVILGGLASGKDITNGRNSTTISIKLEILMLPNPTPDNR